MQIEAVDRLEDKAQSRAQENLTFALEYQKKIIDQTREIEAQAQADAVVGFMGDAFVLIWVFVFIMAAAFCFNRFLPR